ncbi:enoyl-CoA hydratase/isomerase family protein [Novosphingobium sp. MD-1]|uniref:enoyl-CoA hydratase/isomerase family protein n=1 Tax=Novosphingobium sp. MD-1 TaxID=1630648 RepID=UPI00061B96AC|nr:enoyl-CoA hydratase/isomerase family protein [Novosphingobium sp. MD-1]GAO53390.1 enoyl-CoA hydratase [Novosphingobium sp. MD-1]
MKTVFDGVTITTQDAVAIVSFSRPPLNYFDVDLINALADALEEIDRTDDLRAVLLRSEGKVFCAGASFSGREGSGQGELADPGDLYRQAVRLFRTRKPIVVAVQGAAIGGGLGLAMVGDFRIAAEDARFAGNFVKIGIHPGFGLTHILPRVIGHQNTAKLFYTGRRYTGAEAATMGLVDEVVPAEHLAEAALAFAAEIAEGAPLAVEATRATLRHGLADAVAAQTERECREQIALFASADFKEGVQAVAERRPGRWQRR